MTRRTFLGISLLCLSLSTWAQGRANKPAFKGMELYSWQGAEGWCYALMPGTNRLKNWTEVQESAISLGELEPQLKQLAEGEHLSWLTQCNGAPKDALTYPPEETLKLLIELCESYKIQLFLDKRQHPQLLLFHRSTPTHS